MIAAVLDHLWQSTLLAAVIGGLAVVFRHARASVRYGLWLTASVKFLVPFAALEMLGRWLGPQFRPPAEADAAFIVRAAEPFAPPPVAAGAVHAMSSAPAGVSWDPTGVLIGAWALGFMIVVAIWMARWAKIRPLLRQATPVALAAPMPVLTTPDMMEPGLFGLWRPVLLIPETLFEHLERPAIEALVAHEVCHYRRRDNLTAAVHMLVEALFWFHPMVWWIGGRLVEERERACDEAVVGSGHDPAAYAEGLLECCRLFLQSPLRCVAGASGSDLSRRVESIMTSLPRPSLSRACKAGLAAAAICALASPVAAGWLTTPAVREAVTKVADISASPMDEAAHASPLAISAPDRRRPPRPSAATRVDGPSSRPVQQFAALRQEAVQLEPTAEDQSSPVLALPRLAATSADIPDARLVRVADARNSAGPAAPAIKRYCMWARDPTGTKAKVLCMTKAEWKKAIIPQKGDSGNPDLDPGWLGAQTPGSFAPYADPLGQNSAMGASIANSVPAMTQAAGMAAMAAHGR